MGANPRAAMGGERTALFPDMSSFGPHLYKKVRPAISLVGGEEERELFEVLRVKRGPGQFRIFLERATLVPFLPPGSLGPCCPHSTKVAHS